MSIAEKLAIIAANEQKVYNSGYEKGKSEGGSSGSNKLAQVIDRSATEITAEDLAGATEIGESAFYQCEQLTDVTMPNSVTHIRGRSFYYCNKLVNVTLSKNLIDIGLCAFQYTKLVQIVLPKSLTKIGNYSFSISTLKDVYYEGDISSWCKIAFASDVSNPMNSNRNVYFKNAQGEYELVTNPVIPNDVTELKNYAFQRHSMTAIRIGNGIEKIGTKAFSDCTSLTDIYIDKEEGSVSGAPWGAPNSPTIHWNTPLPTEE